MILKISTEDSNKVKEMLNDAGIVSEICTSSFDSFVSDEIKACEDVYSDTFGKMTVSVIAREVEDILNEEEIDLVSKVYYEKVQEYAGILDARPIGIHTISNNLSVQLKELNDDEFVCVVDKDVYKGETIINEEDLECVSIGELVIPLAEFIRVQPEPKMDI